MSNPSVAILNYGIGNLRSIYNALCFIDAKPMVTDEVRKVMAADALILPGVGAFHIGMQNLIAKNLPEVIHQFIQSGKPLLGICLGMQLLFTSSTEYGEHDGLNIITGKVEKITTMKQERLPHVGWKTLLTPQDVLATENKEKAYFIHSYHAKPIDEKTIIARTEYAGQSIIAAVRQNNVYGMQFHPEKSGSYGLQILQKFITFKG